MNKQQSGFTIVELLLAMTFFSFILLFVISGFIQINRTYTRGLTQNKVQNAARLAVDDLGDAIRNSTGDIDLTFVNDANNFRICVGSKHYAFNRHIGTSGDALNLSGESFSTNSDPITLAVTDEPGHICDDPINPDPNVTRTLLDSGLIVQDFSVTQVATSGSYRISITISTDTVEDFDVTGEDAQCRVITGDEFCYVVKLETAVSQRN